MLKKRYNVTPPSDTTKLLKRPSRMCTSHESDREGNLLPPIATLLTMHFTSVAKKTLHYLIIHRVLSVGCFSFHFQKAIRVTTFMQRLRASEAGSSDGAVEAHGEGVKADGLDGKGTQKDSGGFSTVSMSHEVSVESRPVKSQEEDEAGHKKVEEKEAETLARSNSSLKVQAEEPNKIETNESTSEREDKSSTGASQKAAPIQPIKTSDSQENHIPTEPEATTVGNVEKKSPLPDTPNRRKMAANLSMDHSSCSYAKTGTLSVEKETPLQSEDKKDMAHDMAASSWCQTQLPEAVAEKPAEVGSTCEVNPNSRELKKGRPDKGSQSAKNIQCTYAGLGSSSLGHDKTVFEQELQEMVHGASGYGSPYCPTYSVGQYSGLEPGSGASADWQMDCVIEQIEKQMAAVLEKIEGDMPSLLEQISDHPETLPRAKSASSSPSPRPRSYHHSTPPPLPTTPRPAMPSLPHLTIPPPSYPPPSPPSHVQGHSHPTGDEGNGDGQKSTKRSGRSPRGSVSGKGL